MSKLEISMAFLRFLLIKSRYIVFLALIVLIFRSRLEEIRARFRDRLVGYSLSRLPKKKFLVLKDLLIFQRGQALSIDYLIISDHGVYIIDIENFSGDIYGGLSNKFWVEDVNGRQTQFRNPIYHNMVAVQVLKNLGDDFKNFNYIPLVVFPNRADFKFQLDTVMNMRRLKWEILKPKAKVMGRDERQLAYSVLKDKQMKPKENLDPSTVL